MIDSYKNIERLRYRLNLDLSEIKGSIDKNTSMWYEEMLVQISSAIISAMAAGVITSNGFSGLNDWFGVLFKKIFSNGTFSSIIAWVLCIIIFICVYILIFLLIELAIKKIKYNKKNKDVNRQIYKDYQKEFDNIACDSIFVAFEYKKEYNNPEEKSNNIRLFFFYEVLHYLQTACFTTRDLCKFKDRYIKVGNDLEGVDIYRIYNMIDLMNEILAFLEVEKERIAIDEESKGKVEDEIKSIKNVIQEDIVRIINLIE